MHLLASTTSFLLCGQVIMAVPLLTPRLLPTVDDITCEIAGLQIADPMQTLAALQRGAIQPPSDLSTDEFTQLLLGCLGGGGSGFGRHTSNFAGPHGHGSGGGDGVDADPSAYGNTAGYPGTTSTFATEGSASPSAPTDNSGTNINPSSAGDNSQATDATTSVAPGGSNGGATGGGPPAADGAAPASVNPSAAATDASAGSSPPDNANTNDSAVSHPSSDPPTAAAPPPASDPPAPPPATVEPPSSPPASSDTSSSSGASPASGPASSDASFNPSGPRTANDAASGNSGDGNSADANTGAPSGNAAGADVSPSPYLPYDGAPDGDNGAGEVDDFGLGAPRRHSSHGTNNAATCDGMACVADTVVPAGVAEAPEVGTNGLMSGNAGGCPSGDVDLCFDLGTR